MAFPTMRAQSYVRFAQPFLGHRMIYRSDTNHALGTTLRSIGLLLLFLTSPGNALAQQGSYDTWFPQGRYFAQPLASSREPIFALRFLRSTVFSGRSLPSERPPFDFSGQDGLDLDIQGEAALGAALRIWQPLRWNSGGLMLGLQAGVFGRFRLEVPSNDLVASDWIVSLPAEAAWGPWSGRLKINHWSTHIGDEMIEGAGAERVDFTSETLEVLGAYQPGWLRIYAGGGVVFRSSLENETQLGPNFSDDYLMRGGTDAQWQPWTRDDVTLNAGLDLQTSDRTAWTRRLSAQVGLAIHDGPKSARLLLIFHDGPSPMGQFFLTNERYWGFEISLEY